MYTYTNKKDGVLINDGKDAVTLSFVYQPIICSVSRYILYYEVLSIVRSKIGIQYESQEFFSHIGDEFIKGVCLQQILSTKQLNIPYRVSLNVNLSCLEDSAFVDDILALNDVKLALEINELCCCSRSPKTLGNLKRLQEHDVMIWLDDYQENNHQANESFGLIDWDIIKVDKSFLSGVDGKRCDAQAIRTLSERLTPFARQGLVFEGVETAEQAQLVTSVKGLSQGYYYSVPARWKS